MPTDVQPTHHRTVATVAPAGCASIRYWHRSERPVQVRRAPVLFVHGYAGTEHIWGPLRAALAEAGFDWLIALRYTASRADIHDVADHLVHRSQQAVAGSGAGGVHLIGHSMGGLVIRDAVQRRGLADLATTAVTIATPHTGTGLARLVPGPAARQMRPGSDFLRGLDALPAGGHTRWVLVHGNGDRVVPAPAVGDDLDDGVTIIRQRGAGHGSVTRHPRVVARIVAALVRSESCAAERFSLAA